MNLDTLYAVDNDAANGGKWMVTKAGFDVRVAKIGNPAFKAEVIRLQKPHQALLNSDVDCTELLSMIVREAMAKAILVDWKAESKGELVPYTPELGIQMMEKYPDFQEDVSVLSTTRRNFKPEVVVGK